MRTFEFESLDLAYPQVIKTILEEGKEVSPRGFLTKEISPVTITITNPKKRVISHPIRKLNYGFMVGESLWYLSGTDDMEQVAHYNKQWRNYSDDGKTLNGAYGKRLFAYDELNGEVINQYEAMIEKFKKDKDSRHGTLLIFRPSDLIKETKDVPCNNLLRFSIRDNKLQLINFVRSNDIIFGTPYDMQFFMLLQEITAKRLGVELGNYVHIVDSLHIYEMHFEMGKQIVEHGATNIYDKYESLEYGLTDDNYQTTLSKVLTLEQFSRGEDFSANSLLILLTNILEDETIPNGWKNYAKIIASYNLKKAGHGDLSNNILDTIEGEYKSLCSWRV